MYACQFWNCGLLLNVEAHLFKKNVFIATGNDDEVPPLDFDEDERGGRSETRRRSKDTRSVGQKILDQRKNRPNRKKWLTENVKAGM